MRDERESHLLPAFVRRLADPAIRSVMLAGCGGGFDFVHGLTLVPELRRLGKRVVIGSYSFTDPESLEGETSVVFEEGYVEVRKVTSATKAHPLYGPEVHVADLLDRRYPDDAPHEIYAYDGRQFTVPLLTRFYRELARRHDLDAIVLIDGGSDALMRGDEASLGTPVEDHVAIRTVASLDEVPVRLLLVAGLGCDRFHGVTDAATLRAVAELGAAGGFLGALALEPDSPGFRLFVDALDHVYARQRVRSVVAGAIAAAAEGGWGSDEVAARLRTRVRPGSLFVWPLMAMLWGFDVEAVARRSWIGDWLAGETTVRGCYEAIERGRLEHPLRAFESLPDARRYCDPAVWRRSAGRRASEPRGEPVLETDRLLLRPATAEDAPAVLEIKQDPLVREMALGLDHQTTEDDERSDLARAAADAEQLYTLLVGKDDRRTIGYVRIDWMDRPRRAWLRFALGSERGRGLMREALEGLLGRLFSEGLHRVDAEAFAFNDRSLHLLRGLGFRKEGLKREAHVDGGARADVVVLGLLARDFAGATH